MSDREQIGELVKAVSELVEQQKQLNALLSRAERERRRFAAEADASFALQKRQFVIWIAVIAIGTVALTWTLLW